MIVYLELISSAENPALKPHMHRCGWYNANKITYVYQKARNNREHPSENPSDPSAITSDRGEATSPA